MKKIFASVLLACVMFVTSILSPMLSVAQKAAPPAANISLDEWEVLRLTNHERHEAGLEPLTTFPLLQEAAHIRADELCELFSHTRPDGSTCWTVLDDVGIFSYSNLAENIAAGYPTPAAVVEGWMNSSGHRANILNGELCHLGVGRSISGGYIYWAQFFYTAHGCEYTELELIMPDSVNFDVGTSIDEMGITGMLDCDCGAVCYLPISADFCSGYDQNASGRQLVTVSCLGFTAEFEVVIGNEEDEPLIGDANGNGRLEAMDAMLTLRHAMGMVELSVPLEIIDFDGSGGVTAIDALLILREVLQ